MERHFLVPPADPGRAGLHRHFLLGVSCTSPTACTAVGYNQKPGSFTEHRLAEAWNGTSWSLEHPPAPGGAHRILGEVSCVPAGGCTAVGNSGGLTLADAKP